MMQPGRRRGVLIPSLFVMIGLIVLIGLGTWQLERRSEKEALIQRVDRHINAPAGLLPPPDTWEALDPEQEEYRRVHFTAEILTDEALVYTSGSAFRPDVSGAGYWVFSPARLPGGGVVVVNRGFVPEEKKDPATRRAGQTSGAGEVVGVTRWPDARGIFTPQDDPARNLWFVRDPAAIAAAKGWGRVAPFFVEQESPVPPSGLPQAGRIRPTLPNNHLQYAVTWYGLAVVLVAVFAFWLRGRRGESA